MLELLLIASGKVFQSVIKCKSWTKDFTLKEKVTPKSLIFSSSPIASCIDDTKFYNYCKNRNENTATKRTVFSQNSATAERQLSN